MSDQRKKDHINLTEQSRPTEQLELEGMFYEPLISPHPTKKQAIGYEFIGHQLDLPMWVSSMTGGTKQAKTININLAKACGEFGMGMGLGSCRSLLVDDERLSDFDVKKYMGSAPLYTNFGLAQIEELVEAGQINKLTEITDKLTAQGIIIHVNPLQEYAQAEGDKYKSAGIDTIKRVIDAIELPLIVKEVGQGFGPKSLKLLCELPLQAVELAGFGGTNFTILEQARLSGNDSSRTRLTNNFGLVGHTCKQMISWLNAMENEEMQCQNFIISGGIVDPLAGYVLNHSLRHSSVFGMASTFLKFAQADYETLQLFVSEVREQLQMANVFIKGE